MNHDSCLYTLGPWHCFEDCNNATYVNEHLAIFAGLQKDMETLVIFAVLRTCTVHVRSVDMNEIIYAASSGESLLDQRFMSMICIDG